MFVCLWIIARPLNGGWTGFTFSMIMFFWIFPKVAFVASLAFHYLPTPIVEVFNILKILNLFWGSYDIKTVTFYLNWLWLKVFAVDIWFGLIDII